MLLLAEANLAIFLQMEQKLARGSRRLVNQNIIACQEVMIAMLLMQIAAAHIVAKGRAPPPCPELPMMVIQELAYN
jgi:hypothetical protein